MQRVTVNLEDELAERLGAFAGRERRSLSAAISLLLDRALTDSGHQDGESRQAQTSGSGEEPTIHAQRESGDGTPASPGPVSRLMEGRV